MRICSIITSFTSGGAEMLVCNLAEAFAQAGHQAAILSLSDAGQVGNAPATEAAMRARLRDGAPRPFRWGWPIATILWQVRWRCGAPCARSGRT